MPNAVTEDKFWHRTTTKVWDLGNIVASLRITYLSNRDKLLKVAPLKMAIGRGGYSKDVASEIA